MPTQVSSNSFSDLRTSHDLAALLDVSYAQLRFVLYRLPGSQRYRAFQIRKRSGRIRTILSPIQQLKEMQERLNWLMTPFLQVRYGIHGFVVGRSILSNAQQHVGSRTVL